MTVNSRARGRRVDRGRAAIRTLGDVEYWSLAGAPDAAEPTGILLLPAYDEFVVGYADRSLFTPEGFTGNPVFQNVILQARRDRRHLEAERRGGRA